MSFFRQAAQHAQRHSGLTLTFRHYGLFGLFALAVLDSSPLPTLAGPDILTAILAATHRAAWYECAAVATVGSVVGAYITFKLARKAGASYLEKFGHARVAKVRRVFASWGTMALATSAAVPFPFPTSALFAVAGASGYSLRKYLAVVTVCRAVRYSAVALLADHYGRHFLRVVRHPDRYWEWLLLLAGIVAAVVVGVKLVNRRLEAATAESSSGG